MKPPTAAATFATGEEDISLKLLFCFELYENITCNTFALKKEDIKDGFLRSLRCFTLCHCIVFLFFPITHNGDSLFKFGEHFIKSMILSQKKKETIVKENKQKIYIIIYN